MAGPSVTVRVLGDLKGLGQSLGDAGDKAQSAAGKAASAFKGWLSNINATGALGPIGPMLDGIGSGIDTMVNKAKGIGPAMEGGGAALAGLGAGLSAFGSKQQAAQQQLDQAIQATGHTWDEYGGQIDEAIKHGEKYGETADKTQDALRALTQATHDPAKALDMMSTAENVAAAKHEDLATAATQVGKVYNGNTKLLKEYGISIDKNTGLTKDGKTATEALAQVTQGQASAAADTFKGKLDALRATATDAIAQFGQKFGPAMQVAGVAMMTFGAMMDAGMGPLLLIIGGIAALIAIGYLLYTNWNTIWSAIQAAIGFVWQWIVDHWPLLLGILLGPIGIAVSLIITYWSQIKDALGAAVDFMKRIWDDFVGFVMGIPGRVAGFFQSIWDGIKRGVSDALDWVRQQFDNVVGFFAGLPGRISSAVVGMFDGISNAFKSAINFVIRGWNSLNFTMPSVDTHIPGVGKIGGWTIGLPHIPELATGGIVTSPTLALIGERGPEAVVPLGNMGPAVVIESANFSQELDVDLFMRRAAWIAQTQRT